MVAQDISEGTNRNLLRVLLVLSLIVCSARGLVRWRKAQAFQLEDFFIWLAVACFISFCAMCVACLPTLSKVSDLNSGVQFSWPDMLDDLNYLLRMMFPIQLLFWLTIWSVKFSLLWMLRRLTTGIPSYGRAWMAISIFTFLTLVGCFVTNFTSCSSLHAWFTPGDCLLPSDAVREDASLWYSLAVDLLTDLLIMTVPMRLLWNLQVSRIEKVSLGVAFSVGIITMIFAIIRTISLDATAGSSHVSTTWLIFWGAVECFVAIIVGTLPAFAIFIRGRPAINRTTPASDRYALQQPLHRKSRVGIESVLLDDMEPAAKSAHSLRDNNSWLSRHSVDENSDEEQAQKV